MRVDLFRQIARQLMREHGLYEKGWRYETDKSQIVGRLGQCRYGSKKIRVSLWVIRLNRQKWAIDILKHEIAHALAGYTAEHGPEWQRIFKDIGGSGMKGYPDVVVKRPKHMKQPVARRKRAKVLESSNEGVKG